jgi:hypothetical protein
MDWLMKLVAIKLLFIDAAFGCITVANGMQRNLKGSILHTTHDLHGRKFKGFVEFCKAFSLSERLCVRAPALSIAPNLSILVEGG